MQASQTEWDETLTTLNGRWKQARVLVVGDLMLDRYLWGDVQRISPEAPVPVVRLTRQHENAGGAGNVAANLAGLGTRVSVAGLVGDDEAGRALIALLQKLGADTRAIITTPGRPTVLKTRVIGRRQQMLRVDAEEAAPLTLEQAQQLLAAALAALEDADAVVLSDYAKGALPPETCRALIAAARARGVPVLVDPKSRDFAHYAGATTLCPNRAEMAAAAGLPPQPLDALLDAAAQLRAELNLDFLTVTLGEQGIALIEPGGRRHFPATAREVFDVSGAGDTVIATLAAGLAAGLSAGPAAHLANLAAGVVVGKVGTVPIHLDELRAELSAEQPVGLAGKIMDEAALLQTLARWRQRGETVVFTNGCFDLLHAGHVTYLEQARHLGSRLVLGLNDDASVRRLKGPGRPVTPQADRAAVLAALASVDAVCFFSEDTPLRLIQHVRPDVLVKGGDYEEATIVGALEVKAWGGRVAVIPLVPGRSTTGTIERMKTKG